MENKVPLNSQGCEIEAIGPFEQKALGTDRLLKLTALVYLKEALIAQEYETCQELIDTAKALGVEAGDISAVIADYLLTQNAGIPKKQGIFRLRSY